MNQLVPAIRVVVLLELVVSGTLVCMCTIGGPPEEHHVYYYFAEIQSPIDRQNGGTTLF